MNRGIIIIGVAVAVTGAMFFLCANAHIDFFPCEIARIPTRAGSDYLQPQVQPRIESGTCSLLMHLHEPIGGEYSRLTGAGWAYLSAFCLGIGVVFGLIAGFFLRSKDRSPARS